MDDKILVQIRLSRALVKELDHRCVDLDLGLRGRTTYIERLLRADLAISPTCAEQGQQ